jgi:NTP pyrophosphatase (non-canonical NTP hydrolase)
MTQNTTAQEHNEMVRTLAKPGEAFIIQLTRHKGELMQSTASLMGEAGELFDWLKPYLMYGKPLDDKALAGVLEELGDIEFYLAWIRQQLNLTRDQTLQHNLDKLGKRYAEKKYSDEQAVARADKS